MYSAAAAAVYSDLCAVTARGRTSSIGPVSTSAAIPEAGTATAAASAPWPVWIFVSAVSLVVAA